MRRNLVISLLLVAWCTVSGFHSEIYEAYVTSSMDLWKRTMVNMEKAYDAGEDQGLLHMLTEAQYGYIGYCIAEGKKQEARNWLSKAEKNLVTLMESQPRDPKLYSLKGALKGYAVLLDPLRAPLLAKKSARANQKAMELGPGEPRVWMERANMEFYKPALLGGSAREAIPMYEKAVRLFEKEPDRIHQNWFYLNCLTNLGLAYEEDGEEEKADAVYRKLLRLEPSLQWVRDALYPSLRENHSHL